ncbi:hypothetical protein AAE478_003040 [Parahypoxylon ruwenzoriense]
MGTSAKTPETKDKSCPAANHNNNNIHNNPPHNNPRNNSSIPVGQPSTTTAAGISNNDSNTTTHSTYQEPGPGFEYTVTNLPGGGIRYGTINGPNPASVQQPLLHQIPGVAPPPPPQAQAPGFFQGPSQGPPRFVPVGQYPAMPYSNAFMPNQGQHFQPPVPDTTYGPIPHTYHPRYDSENGQFVIIDGRVYQVVQGAAVQSGAPAVGGMPVQYVLQQPAPGVTTAPIMLAQGNQQQQPVFVQAPSGAAPHTTVVGQPSAFPFMGQGQVFVGGGGAPGAVPISGGAPDIMGIGKTGREIQMEQYHTALNNKALEGQDIAPADPDPSRMYYCRELDGEWTLRNRYGIDNMGDCRWYVMPGGIFYAVRLAD